MVSTFYRPTTLVIFAIFLTTFGSALHIEIRPQHHYEMKSNNKLKVTCVFGGRKEWKQTILSIQITKDEQEKPIVSMIRNEGLKLIPKWRDNMQAKGNMDDTTNIRHLSLIIRKPRIEDFGSYTCRLFGLDHNHEMFQESATSHVNFDGQNIKAVLAELHFKVSSLMTTVGIAESTQKKAMSRLDRQKQDIDHFDNQRDKNCQNRGGVYYKRDKTCLWVESFKPRNWNQAREKCQEMGGDLVQIHEKEKNDFLTNWLGKEGYAGVWIGLRNYNQYRYHFQWVNGSTRFQLGPYKAWNEIQPLLKDKSICVALYCRKWMFNSGGKWGRHLCKHKEPFVCSIPAYDVCDGSFQFSSQIVAVNKSAKYEGFEFDKIYKLNNRPDLIKLLPPELQLELKKALEKKVSMSTIN